MTPDIDVPGPSQAEQALQREQTELLRMQRDILTRQLREQQLLAPFLFEEAGVSPIRNEPDPVTGSLPDPELPEGALIGFERLDDPTRELREDIERGFLERTQAALAGELPINPALETELSEQEERLREQLRRQVGPGFETSSPGIEALSEFQERATNLREAARRGDLTLAEQLGIARQGANEAQIDSFLQRLIGVNQSGLPLAQGFGGAAAGFGNAANFLRGDRMAQLQADIAGAQAGSQSLGSLFEGVGTLGGFTLSRGLPQGFLGGLF